MKQCFSFIARTYPDRPGLDLCTPESDYWMIDDGHITALREGKPRGNWALVNREEINIADLAFWGFDLSKIPRIVMLNIERMDHWAWCRPSLTAIVTQLREMREDVTICLYAHNDGGHADWIVDAMAKPANYLGRQDGTFSADAIPVLHPGNYDVGNTATAMRRLHDQGLKTLLLWEVAAHQQYPAIVASHAALSKAWRSM